MHSVEFQIGALTFAFSQTGRVDRNERLPIQFKMHINANARCTCDFTDNHPIGFGERVYKSTLSDIPTSNDRQFHLRRGNVLINYFRHVHDQFEQTLTITILSRTGAQDMLMSQLVEFLSLYFLMF